MHDRDWLTTPVTTATAGDADALLRDAGVDLEDVAPGVSRRWYAAVDVATWEVGAAAVVDVDASGSAWVRGVAGDAAGLAGLGDTLRATGARRLVAPARLGDADAGWRRLADDPPVWALEM